MRRFVSFISALLTVLGLATAGYQPVRAAAMPLLSCRLDSSQLIEGGKTTLWIEVQDINDFYAYQMDLRYDPSLVTLLDSDSDPAAVNFNLGILIDPDFVVMNEVDTTAGRSSLALTQINPTPAVAGSGWLARIDVQALKAGKAAFMFSNVILADSQANVIVHNLQGCMLDVLAAGQPTRVMTTTPQPTYPVPTSTPPGPQQQTAVAQTAYPSAPAPTQQAMPTSTPASTAANDQNGSLLAGLGVLPVTQVQGSEPTPTPTNSSSPAPIAEIQNGAAPAPVVVQSGAGDQDQQMPMFVKMVLVGMGLTLVIGSLVLFFLWKRGRRLAGN